MIICSERIHHATESHKQKHNWPIQHLVLFKIVLKLSHGKIERRLLSNKYRFLFLFFSHFVIHGIPNAQLLDVGIQLTE